MKKRANYSLIILIALIIVCLLLGTLFLGNKSFSENENRYLQQRPKFSIDSMLSGKFETATENFFDDQMPLREGLISLKSNVELLSGVRDINGAYILKNGFYAQKITEADFNSKRYTANLKALSELQSYVSEKGHKFTVLFVPTAAYVYSDLLAEGAPRFDEDAVFNQACQTFKNSDFVDIRSEMLFFKSKGLYYATDHHWTDEGVRIAYNALFGKAAGEQTVLATGFRGTLYSKVLTEKVEPDVIKTLKTALDVKSEVTTDNKSYDSIFVEDLANKKDLYAMFMGGNYAKATVVTESADTDKSLLLIKDSYANAMMPYLITEYKEITLIDPRYYQGDLKKLSDEYDEVLFLSGIQNMHEIKLII